MEARKNETNKYRWLKIIGLGALAVGAYAAAHTNNGPGNLDNYKMVYEVATPGSTIQGLINKVDGPLPRQDLFPIENGMYKQNNNSWNIMPGAVFRVPDIHQPTK